MSCTAQVWDDQGPTVKLNAYRELLDILPVLMQVERVPDVRAHLSTLVGDMTSQALQRHSMYGAQ